MHFGHMICQPRCHVSLHGSLHHRLRTNHSTDGHGTKGGGAPYMHIRTEVCKSKEEKPQTLRKQTYLGSVDQKKG